MGLPHQNQYSLHKDAPSILKEIKSLTKTRYSYPYEIDGLVIKVNQFDFRKKLGYKAKTPRYACAFKFPATTKATTVNDITIQVGRTGSLTPVAELEPVHIDGTTVSRATLHNQDEIDRKDVRIGDTVVIRKAGDIIPEVVSVLTEFRKGKEKTFKIPDFCPVCNKPAQQEKDEAVKRCVNASCPAKIQANYEHFISRQGFNIDGLGPKVIEQLIHEGLIHNYADLFKLSSKDLLGLPLFKEQKTSNTLQSIQKSKTIKVANFIYSLGIRNIGIQSARDLAKHLFSDQSNQTITPNQFLKKIQSHSLENLISIDGFGEKTLTYFHDWFQNKDNQKLLSELTDESIQIQIPKPKSTTGLLNGKTFLFTGKLQNFDRNTAKTLVENHGGKNLASVSKKLDFLVVGEKPGSKAKKAEELGITILPEDEFLKIIN
jgi:DNA ligase (NAD+)